MINWDDLKGVTEDVARRVLVRARSIAPGVDLLEGEPKKNALAILRGVAAEIPDPGSRRVRKLSRNGTSMDFDPVGDAFTAQDIADLRALCAASPTPVGLPVGSFPKGRPVGRVWPEEYDA